MRTPKSLLLSLLSVLALSITLTVTARSASGDRILVVIENGLNQKEYGKFFGSLEARGYKLTYKSPREETHPLLDYGVKNYDHLIMMAPSTSAFSSDLKPPTLLPTLLSSQINTLFLSSPSQSDVLTSFYREFDIEFAKKGTGLISYSNSGSGGEGGVGVEVDLQKALGREVPDVIIPREVRNGGKPFIYKGITHNPGHLNPYLIPILHAPSGTYSDVLPSTSSSSSPPNSNSNSGNDDDDLDEEEDDTSPRKGKKSNKKDKWTKIISGKEAGLISVFQSRGNVRFGWVGGVDSIRDDVWTDKYSNPDLLSALTSWLFLESGVLRIDHQDHYRERVIPASGASPGARLGDKSLEGASAKQGFNESSVGVVVREGRDRFRGYTVGEEVTYELHLTQYSPSTSLYHPLTPHTLSSSLLSSELQLEFTMLDPHVRVGLPFSHVQAGAGAGVEGGDGQGEDGGVSVFKKKFRVPDRHGVFKFVVDWWRPGYTYLSTSTTTSVIPFRHDQYPRFIFGAYPFYAGAFVVMGSFLVFVGLWVRVGSVERGRRDGGKKRM